MTREEVKGLVAEVFKGESGIYDFYPIGLRADEGYEFQVDAHSVTFERLEAISVALKTKKIDIARGDSGDGCGTCGHGSYHRVTIKVGKIGSLS